MPTVEALAPEAVRAALRQLGDPRAPASRSAAVRALRDLLSDHGTVRSLLDGAPPGARRAFVALARDGPARVEELLGRGWWGRGRLPPPLDWLQVRGLVVAEGDVVAAVDEAREAVTGGAGAPAGAAGGPAAMPGAEAQPLRMQSVRVQPGRAVVIAASPQALDGAVAVPSAALQAVAPTVAVSQRPAAAVAAALRTAGVPLDDDLAVAAAPGEPALPGTAEDAVGPRSVRLLLDRAVGERRQVRLTYYASSRAGAATDRVVDPWQFHDDLLTGWCHLRRGERTFAVDRIGRARLLPDAVAHAPPGGPSSG